MRRAAHFAAWPGWWTGLVQGAELDGRPVVLAWRAARERYFAAFDAEDGSPAGEFSFGEGFVGDALQRIHIDAGGEQRALVVLQRSVGLRGTVFQFDLTTGERVCPDTWGKRRKPWARAWPTMTEAVPYRGPDGRRNLLLGWSDGRVERVDAVTGEPAEPRMRGAGRAQVWSMTVFTGADGTARVAAGDADGMLRVWDLTTGRPAGGPVKAHNGPIARIVPYTVDGRSLLATGGTDHAVRIWDPETRTPLGEMMVQRENTFGLCAYQVGGLTMLAVASDRLYRYDALTGQPVGEPLDGWDGDVCWGVSTVRIGSRVALFGVDECGIRRFDGATGKEWPAEGGRCGPGTGRGWGHTEPRSGQDAS